MQERSCIPPRGGPLPVRVHQMAAASALRRLLLDAGVDVRTAKFLPILLDRISDCPGGSDGLAGALLRWRRREAVESYAAGLGDAWDAWEFPRLESSQREKDAMVAEVLSRFLSEQLPPELPF